MASLKAANPGFYRVIQFFAALRAYLPGWAGGMHGKLSAGEAALVANILPGDSQQRLFTRMMPNDQRHALAVVRTLRQANYIDPALMQAALLHDVAKSLGQPIIHRVLIVLLEAFWPAALRRLSMPGAGLTPAQVGWWRRPFVIHAQHPAIGAAWAQAVGCDPLAVRLIAKHQDILKYKQIDEENRLLAALKWADDLN